MNGNNSGRLGPLVYLANNWISLIGVALVTTASGLAIAIPLMILVATVTIGGLMGLIIVAAVRTRRMRATTGTLGAAVPVGTEGIVQAPLAACQ